MDLHGNRYLPVFVCSILLTGCINLNETYQHDPALAEAARLAEQSFNEAGTQELFQTMASNAERSLSSEKAALAISSEQRFEGRIQSAQELTWRDLQLCGRGSCWAWDAVAEYGIDPKTIDTGILHDEPTEKKLGQLLVIVNRLSKDIQSLSERMQQHVPIEETSAFEVSSSIADAIKNAEKKIQALDEKFEQVKVERIALTQAEIDKLLVPILDPLPNQRQKIEDAIKEAIDGIRGNLQEVENLRALPQEAVDQITMAASVALSDSDAFVNNEAKNEELLDNLLDTVETKFKSDLLEKFNEKFALEFANTNIYEALDELGMSISRAELELGRFEGLVTEALGGTKDLSKRINAVNDLLRKSENIDLVKLTTVEQMLGGGVADELRNFGDQLVISEKFDELKQSDLLKEFSDEFKQATGQLLCEEPPCKLQDVLNYLGTDESKLQAIRTTLRDDFRRATITTYNQELRSLQREFSIMRELVAVVQQQHTNQTGFGEVLDSHFANYPVQNLDVTVYNYLDCVARFVSNPHGKNCPDDVKDPRAQFENILSLLADYYILDGDLRDQEIALWIDVAHLQHRRSIEASKIAAATHEQMIASGLQGLTAFTQGGVTTEEIASILRYFNTALLGVIAVEQRK
jgi:hypothetical protein